MAFTAKHKVVSAGTLSFKVDSYNGSSYTQWRLWEVRCHASASANYTIKLDSGFDAVMDTTLATATGVTDYHYQPTNPIVLSSGDEIVITSPTTANHGVEVVIERL